MLLCGGRPDLLGARRKITILSLWGFTGRRALPITPLTAEDGGAARCQRLKQASEKQSLFGFQSFKFRVADDGVEKRTESWKTGVDRRKCLEYNPPR